MHERLGITLAVLACSFLFAPGSALGDPPGEEQPSAPAGANGAATVEASAPAPTYPSLPSPPVASEQPDAAVAPGAATVAADQPTPSKRAPRRGRAPRAASRSTPHAAAPEPTSNVIAVDVLHLLGTFVLVTYDRRLLDRASLALMAGAGETYWVGRSVSSWKDTWFVGAQARFFAAGSFDHGVYAGVEGGYTLQGSSTEKISLGPLLGYRRVVPIGLAFGGSAGLARDFSRDTWLPILHANVGFAF